MFCSVLFRSGPVRNVLDTLGQWKRHLQIGLDVSLAIFGFSQMWFNWKFEEKRNVRYSAFPLSLSKNANQIGKIEKTCTHTQTDCAQMQNWNWIFRYSRARVWHKLPFKIIRKVAAIFDTVTNLHCLRLSVCVCVCCCQRGVCQMQWQWQLWSQLPKYYTPLSLSLSPLCHLIVYLACWMQALNIDLKICSYELCVLFPSERASGQIK